MHYKENCGKSSRRFKFKKLTYNACENSIVLMIFEKSHFTAKLDILCTPKFSFINYLLAIYPPVKPIPICTNILTENKLPIQKFSIGRPIYPKNAIKMGRYYSKPPTSQALPNICENYLNFLGVFCTELTTFFKMSILKPRELKTSRFKNYLIIF